MIRPLLLLALLASALTACSSRQTADAPRLLSVSGTGTVSAPPDRATVSLAVAARDAKLETAQAEADATVARVLAATDALGIAREQVQTTGVSVDLEYEYPPAGRKLLGYLVSRRVTVQVIDLGKLGALLASALGTGVNTVEPPVLSSSKERELYRAALAKAAEDARANAGALAGALGARVGAVYSASGDAGGGEPRPMAMRAMAAPMAKSEVAQSYEAGEVRFTATVQAQFVIE